MTGTASMNRLATEIARRLERSSEQAALQELDEVLGVLGALSDWLSREPAGRRKERIRQILIDLDWLNPDTLASASPETLHAGVLKVVYGLLE